MALFCAASSSDQQLAAIRKLEALRSRDLAVHETNVGRICTLLCQAIEIDADLTAQLKSAAELHDIGKLAISDALLEKPASLTAEEHAIVAQHPRIGYEVLSGSGETALDLAASIALGHHECYDGSGYPAGLSGAAIPLASRLVSLCDVYDALRANRAYRPGMTHEAAVTIITAHEGRASRGKFDPALLNAFTKCSQDIAKLYD